MGNRAVIAFESMPSIGIYVHWNGGEESVLAFLEATKRRGARAGDTTYGFARLTQTIGDYFCRGKETELLSVGVGPMDRLDTEGDNGTYWIGDDFDIVRREHVPNPSYKLTEADHVKREGIVETLLGVDAARELYTAKLRCPV